MKRYLIIFTLAAIALSCAAVARAQTAATAATSARASQHLIGEVMQWMEAIGLDFVRSIPRSFPPSALRGDARLFETVLAGNCGHQRLTART